MRNQTLRSITEKVRSRARVSTNPSQGIDDRQGIVTKINFYYQFFAADYKWSFLEAKHEEAFKALQAGERYYDFPVVLNQEFPFTAWVKWSGAWLPLIYGITKAHYTAQDSDLGRRSDPVTNWRITDSEQFEVWPIPASEGITLGFDGQRMPAPLVGDGDRCELDDQLIVQHCAGEILAANDQKDAKLVLSAGAAIYTRLKGNTADQTRVQVGLGDPEADPASGSRINPGGPGWPRIIVTR